jgi:hypothetical protein
MTKTIDHIKEKRTVSEAVKEKRKETNRIDKLILKALESGEKTIPQIARETELPEDVVTYNLMTLRKYGKLETGEIDDMDEYFSYKLKPKKKK